MKESLDRRHFAICQRSRKARKSKDPRRPSSASVKRRELAPVDRVQPPVTTPGVKIGGRAACLSSIVSRFFSKFPRVWPSFSGSGHRNYK